ncbi:alpha/beta fold hydrolase [Fangia hongkongensis]|uniref:alpha/beta fold hydrolase n=1 Tax=Fangia hongkongensis TaxID=270495 RepID=UPI000368C0A7|nr:alpha/beta fold hydrolase [Fangia hongkongensis]MBK2124101.1 alpha/beta fold hydrolase [Fangia hongkongensis]
MPDIISVDHTITVPLNYQSKNTATISVYAKELYRKDINTNDVLLYLQGGPGFESVRDYKNMPWIQYALQHYRVVLFDARGTGKSTPIDSIQNRSTHDFAEYLTHFRADNIIHDCESLRREKFNNKPWFVLGQSYGGFSALSYLSYYPEALKGVMIAGGLPPLSHYDTLDIYKKLLANTIKVNKAFYQHASIKTKHNIKRIGEILTKAPYKLPDGGILSLERFLNVGYLLGSKDGFYKLETLLDSPFYDDAQNSLSWRFVKSICDLLPYQENPIYALLHESIYCHQAKSAWASEKLMKDSQHFNGKGIPYFYGENIRQSTFSDYALLAPYSFTAEALAQHHWPALFDLKKLEKNPVPVIAVVYKNDFYVDYDYSLEMAKSIQNCHVWKNTKDAHGALRDEKDKIIKGLHQRLQKRL